LPIITAPLALAKIAVSNTEDKLVLPLAVLSLSLRRVQCDKLVDVCAAAAPSSKHLFKPEQPIEILDLIVIRSACRLDLYGVLSLLFDACFDNCRRVDSLAPRRFFLFCVTTMTADESSE
jgi:hypothetical protein